MSRQDQSYSLSYSPETVMHRAGAKTIYIGVESADPKTLSALGKKTDLDIMVRAVQLLKKHGFELFASYIPGNPGEYVRAIHETIRFARRLDTNVAQFSILIPYHGTVLYEELKERIWTRHWSFYDSQHMVYRHGGISFLQRERLLLKANVLYYTRSKKAMQDVWRLAKRHKLGLGTAISLIKDYFGGR